MKTIRALMIKDLITIKKTISIMELIPLFMVVIVSSRNINFFVPLMCVTLGLYLPALVIQTLTYDEESDWRKYQRYLPVSGFDECVTKYLLLIIFAAVSAIVQYCVGIGFTKIVMTGLEWKDILVYTSLATGYGLIYGSLCIPTTYRVGGAKSRYLMLIFTMIPIMFIIFFEDYLMDIYAYFSKLSMVNSLIIFAGFCILIVALTSLYTKNILDRLNLE